MEFGSRLKLFAKLNLLLPSSKVLIAFAELLEVCCDMEITMLLAEIAALVKLQNNKSHVSEVLHRRGYKSSEYPTSKYLLRMAEKRKASADIINVK